MQSALGSGGYYICCKRSLTEYKLRKSSGDKETKMEIRHSEIKDIKRVMEIYAQAREFMAEHGNPKQWGSTGWPYEEVIREDIRTGHSYVCEENGEVVGTFYYIYGEDIDPTYRRIQDGDWLSDTAYGVIHRMASDGSVKGIGEFCLNWAYEQCGHLRVDTHGDNTVMQSLLPKLGFEKCGAIHVVEDNDPRIAYEKI